MDQVEDRKRTNRVSRDKEVEKLPRDRRMIQTGQPDENQEETSASVLIRFSMKASVFSNIECALF